MPIAVDPNKSWEYVLLVDRELPPEQQTVFELKVLTARDLASIQDGSTTGNVDGSLMFKSGTQTLRILDLGVSGWRNFKNESGAEVPFRDNNGKPRSENWDVLRPEWRRELANAITEQNRLTEEERKN
ncbi:MAG: hypothetical protein PHP88_06650 [bacterium]|nr:hypothetical protein [bacterium]